jgi:hypothetical protein
MALWYYGTEAPRPSKSPYGVHFFHADVAVKLDRNI